MMNEMLLLLFMVPCPIFAVCFISDTLLEMRTHSRGTIVNISLPQVHLKKGNHKISHSGLRVSKCRI